jgi:Na+-translocating ferredoxin:NAD+ oxidoreductase RnfD subunit
VSEIAPPAARDVPDRRPRRAPLDALKRFARTPKGYMLIVLVILLAVALPGQGVGALEATVASVLTASLAEVVLRRKLFAPTSGILTGLFVAMVMDPHDPLAWIAATAALAIIGKHLLRTSKSHIFNPAVLALAIAPYLFGAGESWWGAAAGLPVVALVPLLVGGYIVMDRVNKAPSVLTFLGVYFALLTAAAVLLPGENTHLAQFYRDPFAGLALFFAFFMLTDPPTSPVRPRDQLIFGAGVAILAVAVELTQDTLDYLFVGLLIGNAWWAWRRVTATQRIPAVPRSRPAQTPSPRRGSKQTPRPRPRPSTSGLADAAAYARALERGPRPRSVPAGTGRPGAGTAGRPVVRRPADASRRQESGTPRPKGNI